ncbi:MAG: transposase [Candidatus Accumulibacter sp.]|nr:transposase [Accumulibacter sp.]
METTSTRLWVKRGAEQWRVLLSRCPNAPSVRNVLGTWLLSILDGQRRYAHVTGLRSDGVAREILGMSAIISDESLRRALAHLAPAPKRCYEAERLEREARLARTGAWMGAALSESVREALVTLWILDIDTTVEVLYGHQAGAEIGYNPVKPGRPSHVVHTYWISGMRLVLDAEVQSGKAIAGCYGLPRLLDLLRSPSPESRPRLMRGDIGCGVERIMKELEAIDRPYLFKLRQGAGVVRLIERLWKSGDWQDVGAGEQQGPAQTPVRQQGPVTPGSASAASRSAPISPQEVRPEAASRPSARRTSVP